MRVPESIEINIAAAGKPAAKMFATLKFECSVRSSYSFVFGPSDESGRIHITREQVLVEAKKCQDFFIMDYANIELGWTGTLVVTPMNRDAIEGALSAARLYRRFPYAENFMELLEMANAALGHSPLAELTATARSSSGSEVRIDTVAVRAT